MYKFKGLRFRASSRVFLFVLGLVFSFNLLSIKAYADTNTLAEVKELINSYYIGTIPTAASNADTPQAMVKALGDPYSQYFTKAEYDQFENYLNNRYVGIGITVDTDPLGVLVKAVMAGSPAEKTGIKAGDIIVNAAGNSLAGLDSSDATKFIKGEAGTSVNLTINRQGAELKLTVLREEIELPTVEGVVIDKHIAYIDIHTFGDEAASQFKSVLTELNKSNPDSYIIDLRDDPGGLVSAAFDIAGYFIGNQTVLKIKDKEGQQYSYKAVKQSTIIDKPVIFLTNGNSASASEILSAAVKDYNKAFFIGTKTFGKGVAQNIFDLSNGDVLKLTVLSFYSPLGNTINKVGVMPNFNTGEMSALNSAVMLLGQDSLSVDRTGLVKVLLDGKNFVIDVKKSRDSEGWPYFKNIIDNAEEVYIGTKEGWTSFAKTSDLNYEKLLYNDYIYLNELGDVQPDKKYTVTFSKSIDINTINENSVELIREATGERVALTFSENADNVVMASPVKNLKAGEIYCFIVNNTVKGKTGEAIVNGTVTRVKIAN